MPLTALNLPDVSEATAPGEGPVGRPAPLGGVDDGSSRRRVRGDRGRALERSIDLCEGVIDICSALYNVPGRDLRQAGRSSLAVSRIRQIAMYVAHTQLRLKMNEVGQAFGRDRTTVLHACHLIEDMRDDEEFDRILSTTERIVRAAFRAAGMI